MTDRFDRIGTDRHPDFVERLRHDWPLPMTKPLNVLRQQ
jgi:hypothetical protein